MATACVLGVVFGFVAQRTGFCGAALLSSVVLTKEAKGLVTVLIAVVVTMLGFSFFSHENWVVVNPTPLRLMPAVIGGILFGVGMVLGGGCVAGSLYKAGEGRIPSMLAVVGIMFGAHAVRQGYLEPARQSIDRLTNGLPLVGGLHQVVGLSYPVVAGTLAITCLLALVLVAGRAAIRRETRARTSCGHIVRSEWPIVVGAIVVGLLEWGAILSSARHHRNYGLGILGGVTTLFALVTAKGRAWDPWDLWFVVGIPIGSTISAALRRRLRLTSHEPSVLAVCFLGGLLTGAGAWIGRGCFIGNAITGLALLSIHSAVFMACTILANWATTVCYLKGFD